MTDQVSTVKSRAISTQYFRKKGEFVTRSIAGETIIVPVRGRVGDLDSIYNLNDVAGFIWEKIDGHASVSQLAEAVSGEFEVSVDQAAEDTAEFMSVLESAGMVQAAEPRE
jgi:hypothetical protein